MSDRKRAARQLARDIRHLLPLLFAPLPFLFWAAVRFGQAGLGIVLCFTTLFRYFADAHPGQALVTPPDAIVATQLTLIAIVTAADRAVGAAR